MRGALSLILPLALGSQNLTWKLADYFLASSDNILHPGHFFFPGQKAVWNNELSLADTVRKPEGLLGFCIVPFPTTKLVQERSEWMRLVGHLPRPQRGFPSPASYHKGSHVLIEKRASMALVLTQSAKTLMLNGYSSSLQHKSYFIFFVRATA